MAEIKIEKKSPIWPWIILILAVIGVVIYFVAFDDDNNDTEETAIPMQEETRTDAPNNSTVSSYVNFIREDPDQMGLNHEFTNEALMKLTDATEAMAKDINFDIRKDIDVVRMNAKKVEEDAFETTHANLIREAATTLAVIQQRMQQNAFPNLTDEADKLMNASTSIKTDVLTLDQKDEVKNFFRKSADLLEKMNNNAPEI